VAAAAPAAVQPLVAELAVAPLPVTPDRATGLPSRRYAASLVSRLREVGLTRRIADALSQLRRLDSAPEPDSAAQRELGLRLQGLQRELATLRDRQEG
jgi:DNA primase